MSNIKKTGFQRSDIILIGEYKYLIYNLKKDTVELLPIDRLLEGIGEDAIIPKMEMNYAALENHQKIDRFELLCLLNQTNPLIKTALENFLEDEETRSRKD